MRELIVVWDDENDTDGNYWHICIEGHGLLRDDIEDVLHDEESEIQVSRSSGRPTAFGWTSSGERIAVVFEQLANDPRVVYPVSAYPVPPKRTERRRKK